MFECFIYMWDEFRDLCAGERVSAHVGLIGNV